MEISIEPTVVKNTGKKSTRRTAPVPIAKPPPVQQEPAITLTEAATKAVDVSVTVHYRNGQLQKGRNAHSFTTLSTKDEVLKLILNQIATEDLEHLESIELTTTPASQGQFSWLNADHYYKFNFPSTAKKQQQ